MHRLALVVLLVGCSAPAGPGPGDVGPRPDAGACVLPPHRLTLHMENGSPRFDCTTEPSVVLEINEGGYVIAASGMAPGVVVPSIACTATMSPMPSIGACTWMVSASCFDEVSGDRVTVSGAFAGSGAAWTATDAVQVYLVAGGLTSCMAGSTHTTLSSM